MISIPEELIEQIERGNVLLFIGERILRDGEGQVVVDRLTSQMVVRSNANHPEDYSFPEAAQAYADKLDRNALIQLVRDQLEALSNEPQPIHRMIASLTECKVLVTTCISRRLERAFAEAGRPLDVITKNFNVPFEDERKAKLYKLRGSIDQIESLMLTESDYETFFEDQASISVVLQGYLARKTVLFLGYDLNDTYFKELYRKVIAPLDDYARRAYAFGEVPTRRVASWCRRHKIEVVEVRAAAFLEALIEQLTTRARPEPTVPAPWVIPPAVPLPERPYKLLDYYQAEDAALFFGREQETQKLTSLVHAHRLVLLYGASGTGKTSLLLAGVLPHLEQAEPAYETLHIRPLEDPVEAIRRAVCRRLAGVDLPKEKTLVDFLSAATAALERTLVIFLDQFEEFFIRWSPQIRQSFIAELGELYDAHDVPVKLVFSLREDWLASMSEVEARIPEVYRTKMRLLPLSRDQALQAITAPVEPLGIRYDPVLLEQLWRDLIDEQVDDLTGGQSGVVMPPQLQLVCDVLYEQAQTKRRKVITLADYEAVGRVRGILSGYIETALQEHPGQEREIARETLMALVSSQATKIWTDLPSLAAELETPEAVVERVLSRLVGQRLVRRLEEGQTYELAHDILAAKIATWISDEDRSLKQTQEMLRRELADWQHDPMVLLSQSKFQRINAVRDRLSLTGQDTVYLLRAALLYNEDILFWLAQVDEPDRQVNLLLETLAQGAAQASLAAAKYLAYFPQEAVERALAQAALEKTDPAIRDTAAHSLGRIGGQVGFNLLVEAAQRDEEPQQTRAFRALALIRDVTLGRLTVVPGPIRWRVYHTLAKIRFGRNWPRIRLVTAAGAVGGATGFGVGLTPAMAVHLTALFGGQSLLDIVFIAPILAVFGLLAGASLAFGLSLGEGLLSERPALGRLIGGLFFGGVGFGLVMSPLGIVDMTDTLNGILTITGSGLFGLLTGLGMTMPGVVVTPPRTITLIGGAVGAAVGIVALGMLGYDPFQVVPLSEATVPLPVLLISGGLVGLIIAFSITWAEIRWPGWAGNQQNDENKADDVIRQLGSKIPERVVS